MTTDDEQKPPTMSELMRAYSHHTARRARVQRLAAPDPPPDDNPAPEPEGDSAA